MTVVRSPSRHDVHYELWAVRTRHRDERRFVASYARYVEAAMDGRELTRLSRGWHGDIRRVSVPTGGLA